MFFFWGGGGGVFCVVVIGGDNMAWIIQHEENKMIDYARLLIFFLMCYLYILMYLIWKYL
jgi:fucose permease